jgi:hypothetical protein
MTALNSLLIFSYTAGYIYKKELFKISISTIYFKTNEIGDEVAFVVMLFNIHHFSIFSFFSPEFGN